MYEYKAVVKEVYDGDTVTVDIDLGLNTWLFDQKLRLHGINTPEMRGADKPSGTLARDYLRGLILGKEVTIRTHKDRTEKFGRWLADVIVDTQEVNQLMLDNGYAVPFMVDD